MPIKIDINYFNNPYPLCSIGMILLVCLPLCILIFIQMLSIIDQITIINLERKLITKKLTIHDKIIQK